MVGYRLIGTARRAGVRVIGTAISGWHLGAVGSQDCLQLVEVKPVGLEQLHDVVGLALDAGNGSSQAGFDQHTVDRALGGQGAFSQLLLVEHLVLVPEDDQIFLGFG